MRAFGIAWELAIILGLLAVFVVGAPFVMLWLAYQHRKARRAALKLVAMPARDAAVYVGQGPCNDPNCVVCAMPHGQVRYYRDEDPDYEPDPDSLRNEGA